MTEFRSGHGVPGRAWKSEHPVFTDDIRGDVTARCGELADALGLRIWHRVPRLRA